LQQMSGSSDGTETDTLFAVATLVLPRSPG
jgi:hypothetical protein